MFGRNRIPQDLALKSLANGQVVFVCEMQHHKVKVIGVGITTSQKFWQSSPTIPKREAITLKSSDGECTTYGLAEIGFYHSCYKAWSNGDKFIVDYADAGKIPTSAEQRDEAISLIRSGGYSYNQRTVQTPISSMHYILDV